MLWTCRVSENHFIPLYCPLVECRFRAGTWSTGTIISVLSQTIQYSSHAQKCPQCVFHIINVTLFGLFVVVVLLQAQRGQTSIIYYANLLVSNLIQPCAVVIIMAKGDDHTTFSITAAINYTGVLASLYFKMWLVVDRYLTIALCCEASLLSQIHCDKQNTCLSCVAGTFILPIHWWALSDELMLLCWSALWSGSSVSSRPLSLYYWISFCTSLFLPSSPPPCSSSVWPGLSESCLLPPRCPLRKKGEF